MDDMKKQRLPRFDEKAENIIGKLVYHHFCSERSILFA
ncbi:hypothetical protein BATR1942_17350 [Bacillus atrophaeus 1942]|uniref:Uncharacterized protein n=1 Tax=Bacillus atrophaeus (strain 1942) TaxID=720555 RepID=A0ABN3ZFR7_BACA1|nr:hypothetical protein BATR1942_17350 [Bacillus atrophaeus 1942]EIM11390.1 hypothetical protein UY9_07465 [Bacillus atrophaeus C89]